jgi:hypothetical protein
MLQCFRWLLVIGLLWALPAQAAPTRAQLERVLGGIEHAPTADEVKALGPDAATALIAYAGDAKASRLRRSRAIFALKFAPSSAAREFLHQLLHERAKAEEGVDALDLAAALGALQPYGQPELALVLPLLGHGAADVRHAAAVMLGELRAVEASSALSARLAVERDPGVRQGLYEALRRLRE